MVPGFPCNQFAWQEPETNDTREAVCQLNHGVTFQLLKKCAVNGVHVHLVFKFLKHESGGFLAVASKGTSPSSRLTGVARLPVGLAGHSS